MIKNINNILKNDLIIDFTRRGEWMLWAAFPLMISAAAGFTLSGGKLTSIGEAIIFWIILYTVSLFTASNSFAKEFDRNNALFLKFYFKSEEIYLAKLCINLIAIELLALISLISFKFFFSSFSITIDEVIVVCLGALVLALVLTLLAMISSIGDGGGGVLLLGVISIPLIMPLLAMLVETHNRVLIKMHVEIKVYLFVLVFSLFTFFLSLLICPIIWRSS